MWQTAVCCGWTSSRERQAGRGVCHEAKACKGAGEMGSGSVLLTEYFSPVPVSSDVASERGSRQASELPHSLCFLLWHESSQDRSSVELAHLRKPVRGPLPHTWCLWVRNIWNLPFSWNSAMPPTRTGDRTHGSDVIPGRKACELT